MTRGERLRRAREKLELSQSDLALATGIDRSTISNVEHDRISDSRLVRLEEALEGIAAGRSPVLRAGIQEQILAHLETLADRVEQGFGALERGIAQLDDRLDGRAARKRRER